MECCQGIRNGFSGVCVVGWGLCCRVRFGGDDGAVCVVGWCLGGQFVL